MASVIDNVIVPILLAVGAISVFSLLVVEFSRYKKNQESKINSPVAEKNVPLSFTINLDEERLSSLASFLQGEIYQQFLQRTFERLEQKQHHRLGEEYLPTILQLRDVFFDYTK